MEEVERQDIVLQELSPDGSLTAKLTQSCCVEMFDASTGDILYEYQLPSDLDIDSMKFNPRFCWLHFHAAGDLHLGL